MKPMLLLQKKRLVCSSALFLGLVGSSIQLIAETASAGSPTETPLAAYSAVGANFASSSRLADLGWTEEQMNAFLEGVRAAYHRKNLGFDENAQHLYERMGQTIRSLEANEKEKLYADPANLKRYMKDVQKRFALQESDSGLSFSVRRGGGGIRPTPDDSVILSFNVSGPDGASPIASLSTKKLKARVRDLLPGVAEGVQMMTLDSQAMLVVPPALSFGSGKWPEDSERGTPLIFIVELHEIIPADGSTAGASGSNSP